MKRRKNFKSPFFRHLFYWMLEADPASWQDELLGDKLMEFFQKMLKKLEKKDFPNYFLRKQNFVHELSGHKLAQAQERTFRIIENIVPYLIHAVKQLHYDSGFYPMLDIDGLVKILSTENPLSLVMPKMSTNSMESIHSKNSR